MTQPALDGSQLKPKVMWKDAFHENMAFDCFRVTQQDIVDQMAWETWTPITR